MVKLVYSKQRVVSLVHNNFTKMDKGKVRVVSLTVRESTSYIGQEVDNIYVIITDEINGFTSFVFFLSHSNNNNTISNKESIFSVLSRID